MALRSRAAILTLWLVLLAVCGWWLGSRTEVVTDLTAFVPEARTESEQLMLQALRAGPAARTVLIGLEGPDPQRLAAISRRLAEYLQTAGSFRRVVNGAQVLPAEERQRWFEYRYLLSPTVTASRFQRDHLEQALRQRLQELASPLGGMDKGAMAADPTAEFPSLLQSWREPTAPLTRHGVWFDRDGRRALLMAETAAGAYDIDAQAQAVAAIRDAFHRAAPADDVRLQLAGPGLFAVASRDTTRSEAQRLSVWASVAVALILLVAYRRIPVVALGAIPLITGLMAAAAAVSAGFGGIHGLTLAFGMTLLGIAIDYPVHGFSHTGGGNLDAALVRIWPTMALGVATTALGFGALMTTGFTGLAQLGVFAVCGLLVAAVVTRWVLPALTPRSWVLPPPRGLGRLAALDFALGRLKLLPALLLALALGTTLVAIGLPWEDDLATMTPVPDSARKLDADLRRALGAPEVSHAVAITGQDAESVLQRTEQVADELQALVQAGHIGGFTTPSRYLPSKRTQRRRQQQLPDPEQLRADLELATAPLPFRRDAFEPFAGAVTQARDQQPIGPEALVGTVLGARVAPLLYRGSEGWVSMVPLAQVRDSAAVQAWAGRAGDRVHYLNQRATARTLMARVRQQGLQSLLWGAGLMVLVLLWALRSWRRTARVLLPLALATLTTLAALVAAGVSISLFHLMALLMVVGSGIDYGLFFNRPAADAGERRRTFHALVICATSTMTVFGILSWSELPVLRAIGATVAFGVGASLLFALLTARPETGRRR